jgi:biotin carboxylase
MPVTHLVFVDSNFAGIEAMSRAEALGYRFSAVMSEALILYHMNDATRRTLAGADRVVWIERTTDPTQLAGALRRILTECPIDAVISHLEYCVEALAQVCVELGLRYTNLDAVRLARNKHLCRARLDSAGVPSARCAFARTLDEAVAGFRAIGAPAVVKPASGGDSLLAAVVSDEASLLRAAATAFDGVAALPPTLHEQFGRGIVIEEKLVGELVSVELGMFEGRPLHYAISGRYRGSADEVVELGGFMPARLDPATWRACEDYAVRVCRALDLDFGIFHLEMIVTADGPRLVEANPRLMGGALPILYERFTGHSIHDHLMALHLGSPLPVPARPERRVVSTHRLTPDRDGVIAAGARFDWVAEYAPHIIYLDTELLVPGHAVTAGETIGRFQLVHESHEVIEELASTVLARFESMIGIPLMRWARVLGNRDPREHRGRHGASVATADRQWMKQGA